MMNCEQIHTWIERSFDENEPLPLEAVAHLTECENCQDYLSSLKAAINAMDTLDIPPAPGSMVDDVMIYIRQREAERAQTTPYLPGWAVFVSMIKVIGNYIPDLRMPLILQREAWPAVFATIFILIGILASPLSQPEQTQKFLENPVVVEVNSVAAKIRQSGNTFLQQVSSLRNSFIGLSDTQTTGSGASFGQETFQALN
jgi:anti-sigma factor RsiW